MTLRQEIEQLKVEAEDAGDYGLSNVYEMALLGDHIAIEHCKRAIDAARDRERSRPDHGPYSPFYAGYDA